ncbi:unnamed protein product [Diatraea saccharalis]|uniref:Prolyl endopeptidase n=1 Tax=Diatraea saccharalis TaxID=40085 RepID=A0A9N9WML2_9NEOP|nr:unnamed protein product [Diatraea saccharalis]
MSICMARRIFANHCRIAGNNSLFTKRFHNSFIVNRSPTSLHSALVTLCVCASTSTSPTNMSFDYPAARRDETVVDDYHGIKIKDPYRWLEDPDSEETKAFIEAQNNITRPYLDACPVKSEINSRLTELWNYTKYSCPFRRGDRYFFFKNTGLQNQHVLYVQDSLRGAARVFLDPNALSPDGTVALSGGHFTDDGATYAYGLAASGSDWITIHFKDVATGEDYPEVLEKVKFASMSWTKDNKGLFYTRYPAAGGRADGSETALNRDQKLCYHRLGTPQEQDVLAVEFVDEPLWRIGAEVSDCGRYLIVSPVRDCRDNLLYYADLTRHPPHTPHLPLTQIVHNFEADYEYVTNEGSVCIFRTNKNASNYRLIQIDLENPAEENWTTLVPEHERDVLRWAAAVGGDKLVLHYVRDVKSVLQLHRARDGALLRELPLDKGAVGGFSGRKNQTEIFYQLTSFLTPGIIYHVDLADPSYEPTVFREVEVKGFDASQYEVEQIFYSSKDGTEIPMFIVSKKGLPRDGCAPALVYGYGGFNINVQPSFSVTRLVFMQHFNGVVAIPNIRGGGEYGERWHNAGRLLNKQNVFDDFQAAAEYLLREGYTRAPLLTIQGGSNGGLLVAACCNQRPDLYGAAIVQVGVLDMLRFQKFTIGHAWVSDYGSSDDEAQFHYLLRYSPLHNLPAPAPAEEGGGFRYPATLVLTADHDDRVVPLHSLKYIAALQHRAAAARPAPAVQPGQPEPPRQPPLLARVDTKAGHGSGKPTAKIIEEHTDILCFMTQALGLRFVK